MKRHINIIICALTIIALLGHINTAKASNNKSIIKINNLCANYSNTTCIVSMDIELDSLKLKGNQQVLITPYIETADQASSVSLPTVCVSGRNMHYVYLRTGKAINYGKAKYDIKHEVQRKSNKQQTLHYNESISLQPWMFKNEAEVRVQIDTCGCGKVKSEGNNSLACIPMNLNPMKHIVLNSYPAPVVEKGKIINHHGVARVEFEVDKFKLHQEVYSYVNRFTKKKHTIDNRKELKTIDDSIQYALSNPNVEIQSINICGYASPESPYQHNEYLATNRSRALSEYIAANYNLPEEKCTYNAVPENWEGFRKIAEEDNTLTELQRKNLLELIDRKVYGPSDYDEKENELKTSAKFSLLYSQKIHPDWFPKLRYTDFVIRTQLKPLSVEQLHKVLKETPELMSLNQIYTVANDCEHGSEEFRSAIAAALKYYPEDVTANANAAALAIEDKKYAEAAYYLDKAGNSNEAINMRGILEVNKGNFNKAYQLFEKAAPKLSEAYRNMQVVKNLKNINFPLK